MRGQATCSDFKRFVALAAVLAIAAFGLDLAGLFSIIQDGFGDRTHEWGGVIN